MDETGLAGWLVKTCECLQILKPTPIQRLCIPSILGTRSNVIGVAPTGSGKTACYGLPIVEAFSNDPQAFLGLSILPTRELAVQVAEQLCVFGASVGFRCAKLIGGGLMASQLSALDAGPHFIVCTPGRLLEVAETKVYHTNFQRLKYVVFDECDRLVQVPMIHEVRQILTYLPPRSKLRVLAFSATVEGQLDQILKTFDFDWRHSERAETPKSETAELKKTKTAELKKPETAESTETAELKETETTEVVSGFSWYDDRGPSPVSEIESKEVQSETEVLKTDFIIFDTHTQGDKVEHLTHYYLFVPENVQLAYLTHLVTHDEEFNTGQGIIFVPTKVKAELFRAALHELKVSVCSLHSLQTQKQREANLGKFRLGTSRILIATDVASRGLDIPKVSFVININIPKSHLDYVHRVGRTARAGKTGSCLTFVLPRQAQRVAEIEESQKIKMIEYVLDEREVVKKLNRVSKAERSAHLILRDAGYWDKASLLDKRKRKVEADDTSKKKRK